MCGVAEFMKKFVENVAREEYIGKMNVCVTVFLREACFRKYQVRAVFQNTDDICVRLSFPVSTREKH